MKSSIRTLLSLATWAGVFCTAFNVGQPSYGMEPRPWRTLADNELPFGGVLDIALSPNGKTLASVVEEGGIKLYNIGDGREAAQFTEFKTDCTVAFSPDGKILVAGDRDGDVHLMDAASGKSIAKLPGRQRGRVALAVSPDGKTLASGGADKTVRLWDMATFKVKATLEGHKEAITSLAFSPDGKTLASGSFDHTIKLWDVSRGRLLTTLTHETYVLSVAFSPDGKTLASGGGDLEKMAEIRLWDVAAGKGARLFQGKGRWFTALVFTSDGKNLISGCGRSHQIDVWDVAGRENTSSFSNDGGGISLVITADGKTLISGSGDGAIQFWDLAAIRAKH